LYFQAHRGTYTTQARTKQANRCLEFTLREAEVWGCLAQALADHPFSRLTLQSAWQTLLLHQFHDILPGSSIHRVYEEAEAAVGQATVETNAIIIQSAASLIDQSHQPNPDPEAVTVFNSLSWPRTAVIEVKNEPIEVTIPPCGWTTVRQNSPTYTMPATDGLAFGKGTATPARATVDMLENEYLQARFSQRGELVSLVEKSSHWEAMAGSGNSFCLFKDIPAAWDAWDIDSSAELQPISVPEPVSIEVLSPGPLVAQIRLRREIANSTLDQVITLYRSSHCLEFNTTINWQERHKLLKVAFPFNIHPSEALHEIQFGYLRRPTHRSRQYDADRFEVCNHKWSAVADEYHGAAVLNDSKYGLSVDGSTIKLTLLRAAVAPDPVADRGVHTFKYAVYPWVGPLSNSRLVQQGYELNTSPRIVRGDAGDASIFQIDTPNIILDTIKPAEDGSNDLILRLYESLHTFTQCYLTTALPVVAAWQTNMLETDRLPLAFQSARIPLTFRPFEIKTVRLSLKRFGD
jgi:alpha-mannosidase